jgi:dinuclear metal center YbgI/SA1388 family protein
VKVALEELVAYLDHYLDATRFPDYGPNGLQVDGKSTVETLVTGVSACGELFDRAAEIGADAILVHHGLFWDSSPSALTGVQYRRVAQLISSNTSLIAYHLPLDAHGEIGNNALAARQLELEELQPFGDSKGNSIGFRGSFSQPISAKELGARCRHLFGQEPLLLGAVSSARLQNVAIVSGGAQSLLHQAIREGLDAFITGEASEWVTNLSREAGICYVAAGHYATERLGVQALGEHLKRAFGIRVDFVDIPNPV